MRSPIFCVFFLLISIVARAQPKGYEPVPDLPQFQQRLAASTKALQSLQSDFVQTKQMALMAEKITSKGIFYYRKEDKVRIEYTSPFIYLLVMNAGQILVKDEQKSTRVNARGSKVMQSVNRIMVDCMRGSVFTNPDFNVTAFQNAKGYQLALIPASAAVKGMFTRIDVFLTKSALDVERLTMSEKGGDITQMDFKNQRKNTTLNDALFKVR
jgi:outer membrane lipoprotein-sorting protein